MGLNPLESSRVTSSQPLALRASSRYLQLKPISNSLPSPAMGQISWAEPMVVEMCIRDRRTFAQHPQLNAGFRFLFHYRYLRFFFFPMKKRTATRKIAMRCFRIGLHLSLRRHDPYQVRGSEHDLAHSQPDTPGPPKTACNAVAPLEQPHYSRFPCSCQGAICCIRFNFSRTSVKYGGRSQVTVTGWPVRGCRNVSAWAWRHWLLWPSAGFL